MREKKDSKQKLISALSPQVSRSNQTQAAPKALPELATCWVAWGTHGRVGSHFLGTSNSTTQQRGHWFPQTWSSFLFRHFLTTFCVAESDLAWQNFPLLLWKRLCSTAVVHPSVPTQVPSPKSCSPLQFLCPSVPTQAPFPKSGPSLGLSFLKSVVGWCLFSQEWGASATLLWWGTWSSQTVTKPQNKSLYTSSFPAQMCVEGCPHNLLFTLAHKLAQG